MINRKFDAYLESQGIVHYYESDWYQDRLAFYLAGAKAEREEVLEIIRDVLDPSETGTFRVAFDEINRRLKERDNANTNTE